MAGSDRALLFLTASLVSLAAHAAPKVRAAASGTAFVYPQTPCAEPEGGPARAKGDPCGNGWGNSVKILHADGYYSFYVHLDKALVKTGQKVRTGEVIGVMGWTGLAGHRHLHWSLQKLPGTTQAEWLKRIEWDGKSVPFKFIARVNGIKRILDTATLVCPHNVIGEIPDSAFPRFHGMKP